MKYYLKKAILFVLIAVLSLIIRGGKKTLITAETIMVWNVSKF